METGQSQTSSAWWMNLFSQINQLNGVQLNPQQEDLSKFQETLAQLQEAMINAEGKSQTVAANHSELLSLKPLDLEALIEGDAMTSVFVMEPEKMMQAIHYALAETSKHSGLSLQELNQRLASLKQEMGGLSSQPETQMQTLSLKPINPETSAEIKGESFLQNPAENQFLSKVNQPLAPRDLPLKGADEFFYRFATLPGTAPSSASAINSSLRPMDVLKGTGASEAKSGLLSATALARVALSKSDLPNGMAALDEASAKEQKTSLDKNASEFKLTALATRSMLVESSADVSGSEGADVGAEARKESGLEASMKLKLQDPNIRAQLNAKLADRVQMMVSQGIQQARIQLDPPELGMLEVKIQFQQDQVQVNILSQSPQVRDALEGHSVRLRDMLEQQGIQLAGLDVEDQSQQSASQFSDQGQQERNEAEQRFMTRQPSDSSDQEIDTQAFAENALSLRLSLDLFV